MKNLLKLGILLFGISLFIVACQKDDDLSKQELIDDIALDEINIKTIVGKQIPKNITNFLKDKTDNTLKFNLSEKKIQPLNQQIIASRSEDLEIGTVDTSKSVMVVNQTNTKYTFEMVNSDVTSKHNLVVIDLGTDIVNYYISYKPEASWLTTHDITKDMRFFTGDIIFYNTDGIESSVLKVVNGSVDPNTSKVINDPCNEVEEDEEEEEPDDDTTNNNTTGGSSNSGNSGIGTNPNTGGGGNIGPNTEAHLAGACEYTVGQECTGGGHHTSPANCSVGDGWSVTFQMACGRPANNNPIIDCLGDVGVLIGPEIQSDNCEELSKLFNDFGAINALVDLKANTNQVAEKGYAIKKNSTTGNYEAPEATITDPNNPNHIPMKNYLGNNYIGLFHTHPKASNGWYPMFGPGDIYSLFAIAQLHNNNGQPKNFSEYVVTLTVPQGTYAIKIKNWTAFSVAMSSKWKGVNGKSGIEKALEDKYLTRNTEDDVSLMEKDLLDVFKSFNMGIGLYKANEDLSSWSELVHDLNPVSPTLGSPIEQPCE
ncbi:hypothetical protein [Olleya sp. Bg11-27]|uniref:hypothetical protein n=1 Tax=Olleya sp. Bg11-27 TaxID=2058135 RepID=UPI0012FE7CA0|nr:hypothetical protein [Olleya sp. Bg11-27]